MHDAKVLGKMLTIRKATGQRFLPVMKIVENQGERQTRPHCLERNISSRLLLSSVANSLEIQTEPVHLNCYNATIFQIWQHKGISTANIYTVW